MSSSRSFAPWSAEQVDNLTAWQRCGWVHPYTCPSGSVLTPGLDGWVCVTCGYRQQWCWRPMLNGPPPDPAALLRGDG